MDVVASIEFVKALEKKLPYNFPLSVQLMVLKAVSLEGTLLSDLVELTTWDEKPLKKLLLELEQRGLVCISDLDDSSATVYSTKELIQFFEELEVKCLEPST